MDERTVAVASATDAGLDDFVHLVRAHRERAARLRDEGDLQGTAAELDAAHEELRAAEDEMRAQRDQIDHLLARSGTERAWRQDVSAALPVPVVVCDRHGTMIEANAAAGVLLGVEPHHLLGTPLQVFVDVADRPVLRRAMSAPRARGGRVGTTLTLVPRHRRPLAASVVGVDEPDGGAGRRTCWVLLPAAAEHLQGGTRAHDLATAAAVTELCRLPVQGPTDMRRLLASVAAVARRTVPQAVSVSVNLGDPVSPDVLGSDSRLAQAVDGAQVRAGLGPGPDAYRENRTVRSDDVATDDRWRPLQPLVAGLDVGGLLSVPVPGAGGVLGVVTVCAPRGRRFEPAAVDVAELMGSAAGAVVEDERYRESLRRLSEQLQRALDSRAVIDQAKGILMALHGVGADEAFTRLVVSSRTSNVKLREVAAGLVESHARPAPAGGPARAGALTHWSPPAR